MGAISGREFFCALFLYPASVIDTDLKLTFIQLKSMESYSFQIYIILGEVIDRITFGWLNFPLNLFSIHIRSCHALAALLMRRDSIKLRWKLLPWAWKWRKSVSVWNTRENSYRAAATAVKLKESVESICYFNWSLWNLGFYRLKQNLILFFYL